MSSIFDDDDTFLALRAAMDKHSRDQTIKNLRTRIAEYQNYVEMLDQQKSRYPKQYREKMRAELARLVARLMELEG